MIRRELTGIIVFVLLAAVLGSFMGPTTAVANKYPVIFLRYRRVRAALT
jgi:hypothetical protein